MTFRQQVTDLSMLRDGMNIEVSWWHGRHTKASIVEFREIRDGWLYASPTQLLGGNSQASNKWRINKLRAVFYSEDWN